MSSIIQLIGIVVWIAGIILAKGFWSTFCAVIFPLWAWYLVIEQLMIHFGVI